MTKIKREETKISVVTNKRAKQNGIKINLKVFNRLVLALIVVSGISYVIGVNALTVQGFELRSLKKHAATIDNENSSLEAQMSALDSYNNLDQKIKVLGMVSSGKINYIENKGDFVAKK